MTRNYVQTTLTAADGRVIGITVDDAKDDGVNITISSPDSLHELTLTLAETYSYYEAIGMYLDQHQKNTQGN